MLRISQSDLVEENSSLQAILEVKDKLLKAQAEQITALQTELENHVFGQSESERENESHSAENHRNSSAKRRETDDNSFTKKHIEDVPSLFQELQKVIVSLLHKVDNSTRALEAAQWTKQPKTTTNNNLLLSPRSFVTPCTSTEDISVRYSSTFLFCISEPLSLIYSILGIEIKHHRMTITAHRHRHPYDAARMILNWLSAFYRSWTGNLPF